MPTIEDRLAAAMALLRRGATLEGESEVAAVLQVEPQNARALNLLGVAVRFATKLEAALEAMWAAGPRRGGDLPAVLLREPSA